MKDFLKQILSFWRKTYPLPIQIIFLLIFLGGCYVIYTNAVLYKQIEDAKDILNFLIILILLVLLPPLLRVVFFNVKKLTFPMTNFQKCLIGLIFCILVALVFILIKIF